jgi:hypothetical protein
MLLEIFNSICLPIRLNIVEIISRDTRDERSHIVILTHSAPVTLRNSAIAAFFSFVDFVDWDRRDGREAVQVVV